MNSYHFFHSCLLTATMAHHPHNVGALSILMGSGGEVAQLMGGEGEAARLVSGGGEAAQLMGGGGEAARLVGSDLQELFVLLCLLL